jgi:hypothetical protein
VAGRPPKVDHVREAFLKEIISARALVSAVDGLPRKVRPSNQIGIHPKHVNQVTELAFMGVVSAWEEFLDRTLARYVAGAVTNSGYSPSNKYGSGDSISHAYELLSQDANYDPQKHYLKVSDPRWVWRTADFFFSQHPYRCLSNKSELLKHANHIRNRIAHDSEKCKADFKAAAVWFIQPQDGQLTKGYGPGALLTTVVLRHFSQQAIQSGRSHFEAYLRLYENLAGSIVP